MNIFDAIETRRSVKKFDPEHKMSEAEITQLMDATILSPTAFNIQNWRFVVITDQSVKDQFKAIGWNQAQFSDCSALVLICGDQQAYEQDTERYWSNADDQTREAIVGMIHGYYGADERLRRDENLKSGSMAAMTIMLTAQAMGYGSCPMSGFDFEKAAEIVNLPTRHDIIMSVAVGKSIEPARARGGQLSLGEVCFRDSF